MSGLYWVVPRAMHAALPWSLRLILTLRHRFLDTIKCKKKPQFKKFWSVKNCVLESRKCSSPINNSKCLSHQNVHTCMKVLVIAFCGCLSEDINCSLTKQQRQCEQKDPLLIIELSFKINTTTAFIIGRGCLSGSHWHTCVSGLLKGL